MPNEELTNYPDQARRLVMDYYNAFVADPKDLYKVHVNFDEVYVVWFTKTLQNWKALVATTNPDSCYFEVTYNGDKEEAYIDHYSKQANFVVPFPSAYIKP